MRSSRGIKITVFLFVLVLVAFAGLTLLLPNPGQDEAPAAPTAPPAGTAQDAATNLSVSITDLTAWLTEARENITSLVAQIRSAGMSMDLGSAQNLGRHLQDLIGSYRGSLDNMTVSADLQPIKEEFRAALEDYRLAATYGEQVAASSDTDQIAMVMEHYKQANAHFDNALQMLGDQA